MKLLLDTQVLLWSLGAPARLPQEVLQDIQNPANDVLFSSASIWEIAIKASHGRRDFPSNASEISLQARATGFSELPVFARHTFALQDMELHHRDPFDRLLLAQALTEPAWLCTADRQLALYPGPIRHFIAV